MEKQKQILKQQILYAGIDLHKNKWVTSVRTPELLLKTFVTEPDKQVSKRQFNPKS
jgi:hypothetical protein